MEFPKYYFLFIQTYASYFCKGDITKIFYKFCIAKEMFENIFQILLLSTLSSNFKRIIFKPYFYYANKALWPIYKVFF
jgi:hypothetical protein